MKYIVCNNENAVFNRMYDELEKYIEDGAVFSFTDRLLNTQFLKRIIEEKNIGKYKYKNIIFLGQKEIFGINVEEENGFFRIMRKNIYKPLDVDYKNIYYPSCFSEEDLIKYQNIIDDNLIDVAILFLNEEGFILDYSEITSENLVVHIGKANETSKERIENLEIPHKTNKIVHIGYNNLMKARNIFLVALGSSKKRYIESIFNDKCLEDNSVLSYIKNHKNITIFVDKEAGYKSEVEVNKIIRDKKRKEELEMLKKLEQEKVFSPK